MAGEIEKEEDEQKYQYSSLLSNPHPEVPDPQLEGREPGCTDSSRSLPRSWCLSEASFLPAPRGQPLSTSLHQLHMLRVH